MKKKLLAVVVAAGLNFASASSFTLPAPSMLITGSSVGVKPTDTGWQFWLCMAAFPVPVIGVYWCAEFGGGQTS